MSSSASDNRIHLDCTLLFLNITSLAFVGLISFTTNIAGDFPFDIVGAILFVINIPAIGTIAFVQWFCILSSQRRA